MALFVFWITPVWALPLPSFSFYILAKVTFFTITHPATVNLHPKQSPKSSSPSSLHTMSLMVITVLLPAAALGIVIWYWKRSLQSEPGDSWSATQLSCVTGTCSKPWATRQSRRGTAHLLTSQPCPVGHLLSGDSLVAWVPAALPSASTGSRRNPWLVTVWSFPLTTAFFFLLKEDFPPPAPTSSLG